MRTYKRPESVLNLPNLICYVGSNSGDVSLAILLNA